MKKFLFLLIGVVILITTPKLSFAKERCFFAGADIADESSIGHVTQQECNEITTVVVISTIAVGTIVVTAITGDPFALDGNFSFIPTYNNSNNEFGIKYSLRW